MFTKGKAEREKRAFPSFPFLPSFPFPSLFQRRRIAFGQTLGARFQHAAHDLAAARLG
jgi:hypothetical protein